ncbi:hypothetical protein lerEdw1_020772 [Lerista edwardsae]|nr:hypothetical protein lerEdw1_020772 [Lerista edwardsae]
MLIRVNMAGAATTRPAHLPAAAWMATPGRAVNPTSTNASASLAGMEPPAWTCWASSSASAHQAQFEPSSIPQAATLSSVAGFSGPLCEVEGCSQESCLHGGTCLSQSHGIACQCPPGFEGPRCQLEVDSCASSPCKNGGQCQNSAGEFHCLCPQGFEGDQCERDIDSCLSAPCGHGTCMNTPSAFSCICSPGYTGLHCTELSNPCRDWKCFNGGSCQVSDSGPQCICLPGWTGRDCGTEADACDSQPCHQGATCRSHRGAFDCVCPSGYVGATCDKDVDECGSSPCLNSGSCLNSPGSFRCLCPEGYSGPKCQIPLDLCSPNPCRNRGQCVVKESAAHCLCPPGWAGSQCQQKANQDGDNCTDQPGERGCPCLPGEQCPRGRVCTKSSEGYRCLCPPGTKGPNCDLDFCSLPGTHCYYGGTCLAQPEGFSCICPPGYVGKQCQGVVDACFSQPCRQPGAHKCLSRTEGFQCLCLPGYTGVLCESVVDSCQPQPCLNGGRCDVNPSEPLGFTCHCPQGFEGPTCGLNAPPCGSLYCHNGGLCITQSSRLRCLCLGGFSGLDCRLPPCPLGSCPATSTAATLECSQAAEDGHCDRSCSFPETRWDGGDCSLGVRDPWKDCPKRKQCWVAFRDGQCQSHCDNEDCLFDGLDCKQQPTCNPLYERYCRDHFADGHCDRGCYLAPCGWDGGDCWPDPAPQKETTLGLAVLLSQEDLPQFLHSFTIALRGVFRVQRDHHGRERIYAYTGKEEIGSRSNWTGGPEKASAETIGFVIFLAMDGSQCSQRCPTTPQSALNFLGALAAKGSLRSLIPYHVVAAWLESVENDSQASVSHFSGPLIYSAGAGVLALALGVFLGVWKIRRPQRREHGLLWFPPGFAPPQGKKQRCRREPVGEDAIGLKPMKPGAEFIEDSEMFSGSQYDGPLNSTEIQDDPDSVSIPDQGRSRAKKQLLLPSALATEQEKGTKPKVARTQGAVCGLTPLMPLAHSPEPELEQSWADGQTGHSGETPLHLAARYSRADTTRRLLTSGANANARDQWGRTPLHSAIAADALGVFQILLRHRQTDLDAAAQDGSTPLILATRLGVENMVEELVANHADLRAADKRGKSALHWAAAVNNVRAALVLLRNGADKDAQDKQAQTPLFLAAQEGSYKVARLLLQHGAKQNVRDHMGRLPKDVARERLHHDILSLLDHPCPSHVTGHLSPHRPRPQPQRPAPKLHRLPWQPRKPLLPPVPENEGPSQGLPSPTLPVGPSESPAATSAD